MRVGGDKVGSFPRRSAVVVRYGPTVAEVRRVVFLGVALELILATGRSRAVTIEARGKGIQSPSVRGFVEGFSGTRGVERVG